MGYIHRTYGAIPQRRATGGIDLGDLAVGLKPGQPLAGICHRLERGLYLEAIRIIATSFICSDLVPAEIPRVDLFDLCVLHSPGGFVMTDVGRLMPDRKALLVLFFEVGLDQLENTRKIEACFPALVAHEIGHRIAPDSSFRFDSGNDIQLPFGRRIIFPEFDRNDRGIHELAADLSGLLMMPHPISRERLWDSYLLLADSATEVRIKSGETELEMDARYIAMASYFNHGNDTPNGTALIERYSGQTKGDLLAMVEKYVGFMASVRVKEGDELVVRDSRIFDDVLFPFKYKQGYLAELSLADDGLPHSALRDCEPEQRSDDYFHVGDQLLLMDEENKRIPGLSPGAKAVKGVAMAVEEAKVDVEIVTDGGELTNWRGVYPVQSPSVLKWNNRFPFVPNGGQVKPLQYVGQILSQEPHPIPQAAIDALSLRASIFTLDELRRIPPELLLFLPNIDGAVLNQITSRLAASA